jgi:hypothetical protein
MWGMLLRNGELIYLVSYVATVLAIGLLSYMIEDMGGNIQDAFGGLDILQWQSPVLEFYF